MVGMITFFSYYGEGFTSAAAWVSFLTTGDICGGSVEIVPCFFVGSQYHS
jgi:hypothetical protein